MCHVGFLFKIITTSNIDQPSNCFRILERPSRAKICVLSQHSSSGTLLTTTAYRKNPVLCTELIFDGKRRKVVHNVKRETVWDECVGDKAGYRRFARRVQDEKNMQYAKRVYRLFRIFYAASRDRFLNSRISNHVTVEAVIIHETKGFSHAIRDKIIVRENNQLGKCL